MPALPVQVHQLGSPDLEPGAAQDVRLDRDVVVMLVLDARRRFHLDEVSALATPLQDVRQDHDPVVLDRGFVEDLGAGTQRLRGLPRRRSGSSCGTSIISGRNGQTLRTSTGAVESASLGVDAVGLGDVNGNGLPDYLLTTFNAANVVAGTPLAALKPVRPAPQPTRVRSLRARVGPFPFKSRRRIPETDGH